MARAFQYEVSQSRIGGSIWQYPTRFIENSPLFWLDKVKTPLFIMANDADDAVRIVLECYERRCAEVPAAPRKQDAQ